MLMLTIILHAFLQPPWFMLVMVIRLKMSCLGYPIVVQLERKMEVEGL